MWSSVQHRISIGNTNSGIHQSKALSIGSLMRALHHDIAGIGTSPCLRREVNGSEGVEGEAERDAEDIGRSRVRPLTTFPNRPFTLTMSVALMMTRPPTRCMSSCTSGNLAGEKGGTPMSSHPARASSMMPFPGAEEQDRDDGDCSRSTPLDSSACSSGSETCSPVQSPDVSRPRLRCGRLRRRAGRQRPRPRGEPRPGTVNSASLTLIRASRRRRSRRMVGQGRSRAGRQSA